MDYDQIFTELVEKQAQDFGVIDNRSLLFNKLFLHRAQFAVLAP
jgi:hypothetical protein